MIGEEKVLIIDVSKTPPETWHQSIRKTSWGEIPSLIWTIRLYLHVDYDDIKEEVRQNFRTVIEGESKSRTHY